MFSSSTLAFRTFLSDTAVMNGRQLIRVVRKLGREDGVVVRFVQHRGKGSHGTLYYGDRFVVLPDRKKDIRAGLMNHISRQLGIPRERLM